MTFINLVIFTIYKVDLVVKLEQEKQLESAEI